MDTTQILQGLNPQQREAVEYLQGPLLIMAGAGSGKTKVLTCRIANLLAHGVQPWRILAITFTNKAANEMKERVEKMVGTQGARVWLSTFHSFCARMLRQEIANTGWRTQNFVIYDGADANALTKACIHELNLDEKQFIPNRMHAAISRAKNDMQDVIAYQDMANGFMEQQTAKVYRLYEQKLQENNALDFDDLLTYAVRMFEEYPEILARWQEHFQYILIDEYQDTNGAQYQLARALAAKHQNICAVGDPDQSIYGWRGADIRNIEYLERDFPQVKSIKLEQNYRSTACILKAANAVIANNLNRKEKKLWTQKGNGEKIFLYEAMDEVAEAQFVLHTIQQGHDKEQKPYGDYAVLYRMNAQSRILEEALLTANIPYSVVGGQKFYARQEIRDILAYLRFIYNPQDTVSLLRAIQAPRRGIGETTLDKLTAYAEKHRIYLFEILSSPEKLAELGVAPRILSKLEAFSAMIFGLMVQVRRKRLSTFIEFLIEESGYKTALDSKELSKGQDRYRNLLEFVGVARDFEEKEEPTSLGRFLEHIALISSAEDKDNAADHVTLMTIHAAKGLEFPIVFMTGMEEGLFPHSTMDVDEMEEERRACYVGITRAEQKLYLTHASNRFLFGTSQATTPSRFLEEIPAKFIETSTAPTPLRTQGFYNFHNVGNTYGLKQNRNRLQSGGKIIPFPIKEHTTNNSNQTSVIRPNPAIEWKVGDQARHSKWGVGKIVAVKSTGTDTELKINFPRKGTKILMQGYAPIERV